MQNAMASGRMFVASDLTTGATQLTVTYPNEAAPSQLPLGFRLGSLAVLPLIARGRKLGALVLGTGVDNRRFGPATLALAQDLATRAAVSFDNCLLYGRSRRRTRKKRVSRDARHELAIRFARSAMPAIACARPAHPDPARLGASVPPQVAATGEL